MRQAHWTDRAKAVMDEKDMSIADLARAIGDNYEKVKKWFADRTDNPRGEALVRIARALDRPVEWLRYGSSTQMVALTRQEKRLVDALRDAPESERPGLVNWFERTCRGTKIMFAADSD